VRQESGGGRGGGAVFIVICVCSDTQVIDLIAVLDAIDVVNQMGVWIGAVVERIGNAVNVIFLSLYLDACVVACDIRSPCERPAGTPLAGDTRQRISPVWGS